MVDSFELYDDAQTYKLYIVLCFLNPLNAELNPICHLLTLLGAHPVFHISRIRVNPTAWVSTSSVAAKVRVLLVTVEMECILNEGLRPMTYFKTLPRHLYELTKKAMKNEDG